jgi:hypothetical protein
MTPIVGLLFIIVWFSTFLVLMAMQAIRGTRGQIIQIPLKEKARYLYAGSFMIGHDRQTFDLLVDTGSSWIWVPSANCTKSCIDAGVTQSYHQTTSTIFQKKTHSIEYSIGYVSGTIVMDHFILDEQQVQKQAVILVEEILNFRMTGFDGIIGFEKMIYSRDSNYPTMLTNLNNQGLILQKSISICVACQTPELVLGGINPDYFTEADFTFHSLTSGEGWYIELQSFGIDATRSTPLDSEVLLDTGTNLIVVDTWVTLALIAMFKRHQNIDCAPSSALQDRFLCFYPGATLSFSEVFPVLYFDFDGASYTLEPDYYVFACEKTTIGDTPYVGCALDIMGIDGVEPLTLGMPFMKKYATWFDETNDRIGFALPKQIQAGKHAFIHQHATALIVCGASLVLLSLALITRRH